MAFGLTKTMKNVCLLTGAGILSQLIAFVYRVLLTQLIGAEVLGLYQLMMPVYAVLLSLSSIGLTAAVSNLAARYQAKGNKLAVWQLRNQALRLFFILAALPSVFLLCCSDAVSVHILGDARTQLGLLLLVPCLLLTGVENIQKYYFYGVGFVRPAALTDLIEQLIRALLILGLLQSLRPESPEKMVGIIVLGMVLCEVYSALVQTILFRRHLGPEGALRGEGIARGALTRQILSIAGPMGATALLGNLLGSANSVLIPRLLLRGGMELSEAMSQFGVVFGMVLPMLFLPTAFLGALNILLAPKLAESAALGRRDELRRRLRKAIAAANLFLIPSLALLAVLGPGLGAYLYQDVRVGDHMSILALGVLLSCWQTLLANALSGVNLQGYAAKTALICDAIQLVITLLTVGNPAIGLRGFAWGYVISSAIGAWCCWQRLSRETGLRLPVFDWFAAPILASALAASCALLLHGILLREGLPLLASSGASLLFGLLLYLAALQALGISLRRLFLGKPLAFEAERRYTQTNSKGNKRR